MSEVCKVILVGEAGVGKTCIIVRFINNEYYEGAPSTTGANYASKVLEFKEYNKSLQYEIWDTAGEERYRSLAKIFYKDAAIAILVYDITNRKSFEEIKNYWHEQIKESSSKNISKIILFKYIYI
jgi:small GTP-binding protein